MRWMICDSKASGKLEKGYTKYSKTYKMSDETNKLLAHLGDALVQDLQAETKMDPALREKVELAIVSLKKVESAQKKKLVALKAKGSPTPGQSMPATDALQVQYPDEFGALFEQVGASFEEISEQGIASPAEFAFDSEGPFSFLPTPAPDVPASEPEVLLAPGAVSFSAALPAPGAFSFGSTSELSAIISPILFPGPDGGVAAPATPPLPPDGAGELTVVAQDPKSPQPPSTNPTGQVQLDGSDGPDLGELTDVDSAAEEPQSSQPLQFDFAQILETSAAEPKPTEGATSSPTSTPLQFDLTSIIAATAQASQPSPTEDKVDLSNTEESNKVEQAEEEGVAAKTILEDALKEAKELLKEDEVQAKEQKEAVKKEKKEAATKKKQEKEAAKKKMQAEKEAERIAEAEEEAALQVARELCEELLPAEGPPSQESGRQNETEADDRDWEVVAAEAETALSDDKQPHTSSLKSNSLTQISISGRQ
jgi:hypothetical protein